MICIALIAGGIAIMMVLRNENRIPLNQKKAVPTTIAALNRQLARTNAVKLTGRFNYRQFLEKRDIGRFYGVEVDRGVMEYLYPFSDASSESGIYVASRLEPSEMVRRYGEGEHTITGIWFEFTPEQMRNVMSLHQKSVGGSKEYLAAAEDEFRNFLDARKNGKPFVSARESLYPMPLESGALKLISE